MRVSVQVLLSTFNGSRYLKELIDSILIQNDARVEILARDDGSSDNTVEILRGYASMGPVSVVQGSNLGAAKSFLWLIEHSSPDFDFVAFADQDDIWLSDKLSRAAQALRTVGLGVPAMYCSSLTLVDSHLGPMGKWVPAPKGPSFENSLVENIAAGCTIVMNQRARAIAASRIPVDVAMHDWWIYQAISGIGTVIFDEESRVLYRQHGSNEIGAPRSYRRAALGKWKRFVRRGFRLPSANQLTELRRRYSELWSSERRALVDTMLEARVSARARIALSLSPRLVFQTALRSLAYRTLLLLGRV